MLTKCYTKDETLILLSFAMAEYGSNFAHWLRNKLMLHYNLFSERSVYLDCISARSGEAVHITSYQDKDGITRAGEARTVSLSSGAVVNIQRGDALNDDLMAKLGSVALVTPDHRGKPGGLKPIGARRNDWKALYKNAMNEAKVMIFVHTPQFQQSVWCLQEWTQFLRQNGCRKPDNKLHGIVLEFSGCNSLVAIGEPTIQRIAVNKQDGNKWRVKDNGEPEYDFVLNDSDFMRLTKANDNSVGRQLF